MKSHYLVALAAADQAIALPFSLPSFSGLGGLGLGGAKTTAGPEATDGAQTSAGFPAFSLPIGFSTPTGFSLPTGSSITTGVTFPGGFNAATTGLIQPSETSAPDITEATNASSIAVPSSTGLGGVLGGLGGGLSAFTFPAPTLGGAGGLGSLGGGLGSFSIPTSFDLGGLLGGTATTASAVASSSILESSVAAAPVSGSASTSAPAPAQTCKGTDTAGGNTENGIKDNKCCTDLTIIFARGTTEGGNAGTVIGPPMFKALRAAIPSRVTAQGLDYSASAADWAQLGAVGADTMAALVRQALKQCPSTKIFLSGYSQGAMVVHKAMSAQGLTSKEVVGAVLFGDPLFGGALKEPVKGLAADHQKEYCASGDGVCETGTGLITVAHLTYGNDATDAADWIIKTGGFK